MIALADASLSPKAETKQDDREEVHVQESPPIPAEAKPGQLRTERSIQSFAGTIKQLFREVKQALTSRAPAPQPKPKRRKEDPRGLFSIARTAFNKRPLPASRTMARALLQPVIEARFDLGWWDFPLDYDGHAEYIRMLEMAEQGYNEQHQDGGFHYGEQDHLYPHL